MRALAVPACPSPSRRADLRQRARDLALDVDVVVVGVINSRQVELVTLMAQLERAGGQAARTGRRLVIETKSRLRRARSAAAVAVDARRHN